MHQLSLILKLNPWWCFFFNCPNGSDRNSAPSYWFGTEAETQYWPLMCFYTLLCTQATPLNWQCCYRRLHSHRQIVFIVQNLLFNVVNMYTVSFTAKARNHPNQMRSNFTRYSFLMLLTVELYMLIISQSGNQSSSTVFSPSFICTWVGLW